MGLDIVEMVLAVETEFDVRLPDSELDESVATVGTFFLYLEGKLADVGRLQPRSQFSGELWDRCLDVIERQVGLPRARLTPDAHRNTTRSCRGGWAWEGQRFVRHESVCDKSGRWREGFPQAPSP
ncbi:MAG: hypothetical protein WD801_07335 [Gemmatimonadaceae bacterium]